MRCGSRRRSRPIALRILYDATVMHAGPLTSAPIALAYEWFLDVEIGDAQSIVLDELAAGLDDVAHQAREDLVGDVRLGDLDPQQRTVRRVERGLPQLLRVHLAQTLVALDRQALASGGEDRVQQLRRAGYRHWLALGVGFGLLGCVFAFARTDFRLLRRRGALLQGAQGQRLCVRGGLFLGERVELARFR